MYDTPRGLEPSERKESQLPTLENQRSHSLDRFKLKNEEVEVAKIN